MGDKRRKGWPFGEDDDFFEHFEEVFEEMRKRMEKILSGAVKDLDKAKPFVWGYSFRMGPDGKPQFRQFGDTEVLRPWTGETGREPLTDVIEREDTVSITVELPGVEKEEIDLRTTPTTVAIKVDNPQRRYYKEVDLPVAVDPDSIKATFKNGVLDIMLRKGERDTGKKVRID